MSRRMECWGRIVYERRAAVLVVWAVLTVAGAIFGGSVFDHAQSPDSAAGDTESSAVERHLKKVTGEGASLTAVLSGTDMASTDLIDQATQVLHEVQAMPGVRKMRDPYTTGAYELFAGNGQGALVQVWLDANLDDDAALALAQRVESKVRTLDVPTIKVGGQLLAEKEFGEQAVKDAAIGEGSALVVLLVILVVALGTFAAGAIPVGAALATVACSLLALLGLMQVAPVSEYAVNVVTLLGLGLTVDYTLLVLARFREERAAAKRKADLADVMGRTLVGAGHTVLISGLTVGTSLLGLLMLNDAVLSRMAVGGVIAVSVATLAGLTLAPALISVFQSRIRPPKPARTGSLLAGLAGFAQRHPLPVLIAATALMGLLTVPLLSLKVGNSDARSLPSSSESRQAYEAVQTAYPDLRTIPITVLSPEAGDSNEVVELARRLGTLDGVDDAFLMGSLPDGSSQIQVRPKGPTDGAIAQRVVRTIRSLDDLPTPVRVGGPAAELVDAKTSVRERLPLALVVVMAAAGLLLGALTRSVAVPLKALALNVLSLSATLGVVVAIFQWGWGSSLLGFTPWGALDITTPLLLFMFAFGLSMDYHVFLVARIKEAWDASVARGRPDNNKAVLTGITASGPVVTLAAAAIIVVFLGFAAGRLVAVKEIGVGMTVAILLDVTVVRGLLLPATMTLLGRANWWPGATSRT